ncbi:Uncharacterised protein [uncultured archaeon]|nr:Uncharacterised protein [uncultured archaeon]
MADRDDFCISWLSESPQNIGKTEMYWALYSVIVDMKRLPNVKQIYLGNGYRKIVLQETMYYWNEVDGEIILGVELWKKNSVLLVQMLGKNPKYRGKPPYAIDLYELIIEDNENSILRLQSDSKLSEDGIKVWEKLLDDGYDIVVYDIREPGRIHAHFEAKNDFLQYFGKDPSFINYRFGVFKENMLAECISQFSIRRIRELSGLGTEDYYPD